MKQRIGKESDGLYILAMESGPEAAVYYRGSTGCPQKVGLNLTTEIGKRTGAAEILARECVKLAKVLHLAGELERLDVGDTVELAACGDVFIVKVSPRFSSSPRYMLEINGERYDDIKTASDTARAAYGFPGSEADKVREDVTAIEAARVAYGLQEATPCQR